MLLLSYRRCALRRQFAVRERFASSSVELSQYSRLKNLSQALKITSNDIIKSIAYRHRRRIYCNFDDLWFEFQSPKDVVVPFESAAKFALSKGISVKKQREIPPLLEKQADDARVIVLLGHFNHGKTTLLDSLAKSSIASQELHQITQTVRTKTIQVQWKTGENRSLTLVDTPGQDIFYRMRNYGASVADGVLLLVAADDGVCVLTMPMLVRSSSTLISCVKYK